MKSLKIYDLETMVKFFCYTDIDINGKDYTTFRLSRRGNGRNELRPMCEYIMEKAKGMVGFNTLGYDYFLIEFIFQNIDNWEKFKIPNEGILDLIYAKSQEIINGKAVHKGPFVVPQLDLYKMWHFDNKAKRQSLKGLEFHMEMDDIRDMPYHHSEDITEEQEEEIIAYNRHDCYATWEFLNRSDEKIKLRRDLTRKYGVDFMNMPDSTIGEKLLLFSYCVKTQRSLESVEKMKTSFRKYIRFTDVVLPSIKFRTKSFQRLLKEILGITIDAKETQELKLKGIYEKKIAFGDIWFKYGMGGIHGSVEYQIFKSDSRKIIKDADVASLYPMFSIVNNTYPQHLGPVFVEVYNDDIVAPRLVAKAEGRKSDAEGGKIAANSVYGKSNSKYSWLYDPMYTMKTTINCQLLLTMLAEALLLDIPGLQIIQINTDGITTIMDREHQPLYDKICKDWQEATRLTLEFVEYEEMVIKDVNNYLAIKKGCDRKTYEKDGVSFANVKYKGDTFEITKDYHKNTSFKILPYTLSEFFVAGRDITQTIMECTNPFMFFGRMRFRKDSEGVLLFINEEGELEEEKTQKTTRYYISNSGKPFSKKYTEKNKSQALEKRFLVTPANRITSHDIKDYDLNYSYYINECIDVERAFYPEQISLF